MKQEFTDDQIIEAKNVAAYNTSREWISRFNVVDIRAILEALPEPEQDVWQTCPAKNVRKGDRVRWKVSESEDNESYEIVVTVVTNHTNDGGVVLHSKSCSYFFPYDTVVDHIPAPVQHPDPVEHPVILVTEYDVAGNIMECEPTPFFAHDGVYKNDIYAHRPDDVLSWSPAKVVADDENS